MNTPICDFVRRYAQSRPSRMHMPGHKGTPILGFEPFDITEIAGADDLFSPAGIIAESEACASEIFGVPTFYSTAGSTLCIQAMLHLIALYAVSRGEKPRILAGRNAHKAFVNAAALLDIEIDWMIPDNGSYYSSSITPETISAVLDTHRPTAVYLTSPDYLGNLLDIGRIASVCHKSGVILALDSAHGAYLHFLSPSLHPMDLGADICCASAHKTLPVITGGAYLHISNQAPELFSARVKTSLSLFASSSPSYLILQSLDAANGCMDVFRRSLAAFLPEMEALKYRLAAHGFEILDGEPFKITIKPKSFGYSGTEIARILEDNNIYPEFYDSDFIVLMLSPQNHSDDLKCLETVLCSLPQKLRITTCPPPIPLPDKVMTPREAIFAESEVLPIEACLGRICALSVIGCPPAIPIVICGERIDEGVLENLHYYGITHCSVCR